jgi:hypothetical protein
MTSPRTPRSAAHCARAQAAAVEEPARGGACRGKVLRRARAVPVQAYLGLGLQRALQGFEQAAVVQLALARQVQGTREAPGQHRLQRPERGTVDLLRRRQPRQGRGGARDQAGEAPRLGRVLPVPKDDRSLLLEEHRLGQRAQQLRPALQRVHAHAHYGQFGDGRLGQRRQHGRGGARSRALGCRRARVVHLHAVPAARQLERQQPAHQAGAEDGAVGTRHVPAPAAARPGPRQACR